MTISTVDKKEADTPYNSWLIFILKKESQEVGRPLSVREVPGLTPGFPIGWLLTLKPLMVSQECVMLDMISRVCLSKADWLLIKGQKNDRFAPKFHFFYRSYFSC